MKYTWATHGGGAMEDEVAVGATTRVAQVFDLHALKDPALATD